MTFDAPELEAVALDAIAGEAKRASRHALPLGAPCPNCATPLAGPWCHHCGQKGEEYHRSIWRLVAEAFEGLTHFDGRFWNTLPRLVFRPGTLTHEYLEGHRASQIPPFRMFLVVLLLVFFAGGIAVGRSGVNLNTPPDPNNPEMTKTMTPAERAQYAEGMANVRAALADSAAATNDADVKAAVAKAEAAKAAGKSSMDINLGDPKKNRWLKQHIRAAIDRPETFFVAMEEWGHRFAILLLPIAALMLTVLFAFRKGVFVFDHVIFSMHSLSFVGLLLSTIFLVGIWWSGVWWLLWAAPVHLFVHMRGTYRTGVFGTLARMFLLFAGTSVVVTLLGIGLLFVGLAAAH